MCEGEQALPVPPWKGRSRKLRRSADVAEIERRSLIGSFEGIDEIISDNVGRGFRSQSTRFTRFIAAEALKVLNLSPCTS